MQVSAAHKLLDMMIDQNLERSVWTYIPFVIYYCYTGDLATAIGMTGFHTYTYVYTHVYTHVKKQKKK